ncbi:MAG: hypothetical protein LC797_25155, partial [Chloroflexi bacterium]|nr:hypothetical protein [Chloroflexota bacterium]
RMAMQMQISDVLDQQRHQGLALLFRPTLSPPGFADGAFHDVAAGCTATCNRAAEALGPGMVETNSFTSSTSWSA